MIDQQVLPTYAGNFRWVNSMEWSGQKTFAESPMAPFTVDGKKAGLIKAYGPLSFLKVTFQYALQLLFAFPCAKEFSFPY